LGGRGDKRVLMSIQAFRETSELVGKTHHVDPLTERNDSINDGIKRITPKNKEKQLQPSNKQKCIPFQEPKQFSGCLQLAAFY
jgi:hypothetical protein